MDPVLEEIAAGRAAPVYLIHGPDGARHREVVAALRRHLLAPGWEALNETVIAGEPAAVSQVAAAALALPFGGGRRLVLVPAAPLFRPGGEAARAAEELAAFLRQAPAEACVVLTVEEEMDPSHPLAAAARARGRVVAARRLGPRDLALWLEEEARARGKVLPPALASLLVARCQPDRLLLRQELEKMVAHAGDRSRLTRADLDAVVSPSREERVFDLVDAVIAGRPGRVLELARGLVAQGEAPLGLLALLARQYRLIWQARECAGPDEVARRLGVHPYLAKKAWQQGQGMSADEVAAALRVLLEADTAVRRGTWAPEAALEVGCVRLALRRSRPGPGRAPGATSSGPRRWGG